MNYYELVCVPADGTHTTELLIAHLADIGFESFVENDNNTLSAYIQNTFFTDEVKAALQSAEIKELAAQISFVEIPDQNWNAVWESEYEPITISGKCHVRAPFHPSPQGVEYDIVIMPKMSFGTAHHETTRLMVQYVLELPVEGKQLLDMGSGTAVLAILAALRGAGPVLAIDNDEWAYKNAIENVAGNNTHQIEVLFGDSSLLSSRRFDVILANINRNILLGDIPVYSQCLPAGGKLVMSGFYLEDLPLIEACCHQNGLHLLSQKAENNWVAACFSK